MAPVDDGPLCDIVDGKLLEKGQRSGSVASLSPHPLFEESGKASAARRKSCISMNSAGEGTVISLKAMSLPAEQALRLVVGLLGLEVHEAPSRWSEAWLSFEDATKEKLGLKGLPAGSAPDPDFIHESRQYREQQTTWKTQVLSHLRNLLDSGEIRGGGDEQYGADGFLALGPDYQEQLKLAEFMLGRISHTVAVLDDPEGNNRPRVLETYTKDMVLEVCKELRQWLEQLAMLLSVYHVHILDLEQDRRKVSKSVEVYKAKLVDAETERKDAALRHDRALEHLKEEKMRRRAEELLGITIEDPDPKIYSQKDVDDMKVQWDYDVARPLRDEIRDLKAQLKSARQPAAGPAVGLTPGAMKLAASCVSGLAERTVQLDVQGLMLRVATGIEEGGVGLDDLLRQINALPQMGGDTFCPPMSETSAVPRCLSVVAGELQKLESRLSGNPGTDGLLPLFKWGADTLRDAKGALIAGKSEFYWKEQPPEWSVDALLSALTAEKTVGGGGGGGPAAVRYEAPPPTSTGPAKVEQVAITGGDNDRAMDAKLKALRDALEKQLAALRAALEAEKEKTREAMELLASETERLEAIIADLRKKLRELEALLKKGGLSKKLQQLFDDSGLADFLQGRDVFERLYRDALHRMRRLAEAQMRILSPGFEDPVREAFDAIMEVPTNFMTTPDMSPKPGLQLELVGQAGGQIYRGRPRSPAATSPNHRSLSPPRMLGSPRDASMALQIRGIGPPGGQRRPAEPSEQARQQLQFLREPSPPRDIAGRIERAGLLEPLQVQSYGPDGTPGGRNRADPSPGGSNSRPESRQSQRPASREQQRPGSREQQRPASREGGIPRAHQARSAAHELLTQSLAATQLDLGRSPPMPEPKPDLMIGGTRIKGPSGLLPPGFGGGMRPDSGSHLLPVGMRVPGQSPTSTMRQTPSTAAPPTAGPMRASSSGGIGQGLGKTTPPRSGLQSAGSMSVGSLGLSNRGLAPPKLVAGPPRLLVQTVSANY